MMLFGLLLLFPTLHLHNAMGALWRLMARTLLEVKNLGSDLEIQLNA